MVYKGIINRKAVSNCLVIVVTPTMVLHINFPFSIILLNLLPQAGQSLPLVGILASIFRTNRRLASGKIDYPHPGLTFIDILSTFASAAEGFKNGPLFLKIGKLRRVAAVEIDKPILPLVRRRYGPWRPYRAEPSYSVCRKSALGDVFPYYNLRSACRIDPPACPPLCASLPW